MLDVLNPSFDVPRARIDPITTLSETLSVFSLALMRPLRHETLVLSCDAQRRGVGLFALDSKRPLREMIERIIGSVINADGVASISLCTVRAGAGRTTSDTDDWTIAQGRCKHAGLALKDWFLVAHGDVHHLNY